MNTQARSTKLLTTQKTCMKLWRRHFIPPKKKLKTKKGGVKGICVSGLLQKW